MSLTAAALPAIPAETAHVARAAFPKGNRYLTLRDELGAIYDAAAFAALYSREGQPSLSPVALTLVTVMQFMENLSDREAADAVRGRLDWKYLLGLELTDAGFDHSVLCEFRARLLTADAEHLLLDRVLELASTRGWLKTRGTQRTDATQVVAAIRVLQRVEVVGETLRAALNDLAEVAPAWLKTWVPPAWYERYGRRIEASRVAPTDAKGQAWVLQVGEDGYQLLTEAPDAVQHRPSLKLLRRVWIQQFYRVDGEPVQWRKADHLPPAACLIQSPYDVDAHYSRKRETAWVGYKTHLTETCDPDLPHLITQVTTTTATCPDAQALPAIQAALASKDHLPATQLVDMGYTTAPNLVTAQTDHAITLIGPVTADTTWQARHHPEFALAQFAVNWAQHQVQCPRGHWSKVWSLSHNEFGREVIHVQFEAATCQACPQRAQCTQATRGPRALKLLPQAEHEALQAARLAQTAPEFKLRYAPRAGVEAAHSQAVRVCGFRRSRYFSLAKTHLQNIFIAVALNLIRLAEWLQHQALIHPKPSPFARLATG